MLYNQHIFTNQYGEKITRINKKEARNRAARGECIGVCACNMNPVSKYCNMAAWYHPLEEYMTFDEFVDSYEYYNCSYETGYYASYYREVK